MQDRTTRIIMLVVAVLLAILVLQPYVNSYFTSAREPRPIAARGDLAEFERTTIQVFETVAPSVVQVVALQGRGPAGGEPAGSGTGFVWDAAGHVVTNQHVVENGSSFVVRLASGEVRPAEVVGRAPNYDLAVLRLQRQGALPAPVNVGSSADLKVGQTAYAIGNPFGLDQSLTSGIISALKRRLPTSGGREIADVIQTDAAINPGNSGGPLLDSAGRLIGVNTAIFSPSGTNAGIGFAIPVDVVNRVVPELIRTGRVPTPGIGILAGDETLAAQLGVTGVVVADVVPGSPADRAGLRGVDPRAGIIGDVIVGVEDAPVRRLSDLTDRLERTGVGTTVRLQIVRNNRPETVEIAVVDVEQQGGRTRRP
ncbi:S1C family serine protease [Microvirga terrestris]|uniref:Trypsin-like peptidase domain-containing protein n=1 Tax=Microvirga terrestris TaxID=2791024 RepID=A0ABS0HRD1_9HYPH|nr:trypsin-like peptidase domain-containing protein [Microvirga terrestris]MBF9196038.1 trypsin-like peptidase domain-containing protein [Microvirga terrestris]